MKLRVERTAVDSKSIYATAPTKDQYDQTVEGKFEVHDEFGLQVWSMPLTGSQELWEAVDGMQYSRAGRTSGLISQSRVFGFQPRVPIRRDFCGVASSAHKHPEEHATIIKWGQWASEEYKRVNPEGWQRHRTLLDEHVMPCWQIPDSVWTSGIVNKDNALRYHRDQGNFENVWSVMLVLPDDLVGGHLIFPEFRLRVKFTQPVMMMFDGAGFWHAVTRIQHGHRYSVVYYSLKDMGKCLTPEEELKRIRRVKTEREHKRLKSKKEK